MSTFYYILLSVVFLSGAEAATEYDTFRSKGQQVELGECAPGNYSGSLETFEDRHCAMLVISRVSELIDTHLDVHKGSSAVMSCGNLSDELKNLLPLRIRIWQELNRVDPSSVSKSEPIFTQFDC